MRKLNNYLVLSFFSVMLISFQSSENDSYIVVAWNDLGMHCMNKDFSKIAILPPYNNLLSQVIKKGTANSLPKVVTDIGKVTYEIPGNTYSIGKTNFWEYEDKLFGVNLQDNIGLKGKGLTGEMDKQSDFFIAEGIPITPFTDNDHFNEDPYQLANVKVYSSNGSLLTSTQTVIPVSTEMNCVSSGCHSSEIQLLSKHEKEAGFNPNNTPILCAKCHESNALGTKGISEAKSLSYVIHDKHADKAKDDCYKCHPGPKTKCFRDVMAKAGMVCKDCHGTMKEIATSIKNGRKPWLNEPSCGASNCHGSDYAEENGKLFRQSKEHGGIYCSGCHGSPHAIVPTADYSRDNVQNVAIQGYKGILKRCQVCHEDVPKGLGPHKMQVTSVKVTNEKTPNDGTKFKSPFPNPAKESINIPFQIDKDGFVHIEIFDIKGKLEITPLNQFLLAAEYSIPVNLNTLSNGKYIYTLTSNGKKISSSFNIVK